MFQKAWKCAIKVAHLLKSYKSFVWQTEQYNLFYSLIIFLLPTVNGSLSQWIEIENQFSLMCEWNIQTGFLNHSNTFSENVDSNKWFVQKSDTAVTAWGAERWTCNPRLWVRILVPAGIVHDWGETLEQGTEPPTAPRTPQCRLSTAPLGWVKCREHISLLFILCIIMYVTKKAHLSLILLLSQWVEIENRFSLICEQNHSDRFCELNGSWKRFDSKEQIIYKSIAVILRID